MKPGAPWAWPPGGAALVTEGQPSSAGGAGMEELFPGLVRKPCLLTKNRALYVGVDALDLDSVVKRLRHHGASMGL